MSPDMNDEIYTERKMVVGVLLGGALAGGYYFWRTFNAFGKPRRAAAAVVVAFAVFSFSVVSILIPALDRVPTIAFHALHIGLTIGAILGYLTTDIDAHIRAGRPVYGWRNTILVAIAAGIFSLAPMIGVSYLSSDTRTARYYGELRHEIVFDPANLSQDELDRIATALISTGFFDKEVQKTVDAERSDNRFIITAYCSEEARAPEAIEVFRNLRSDLQKSFPGNPIVIDMVVETPDNKIARLE
jgi:hypothetical protein